MNKVSILIGAGGIAIGTILGAGLKNHFSPSIPARLADQSVIEPVRSTPALSAGNSARDIDSPFGTSNTDATNLVIPETGLIQSQIPTDPNLLSNYQHLLAALQFIDKANATTLAEWVDQRKTLLVHQPASVVLTQAVFQRWAQTDVESMIEWMNAQVQPELARSNQYHAINNSFLMEAISGFVQSSPDLANKWIESIVDEQLSQMLRYRVMNEMGRLDPESALAMYGNDEHATDNRLSIINDWAYRDPQAALAWIQSNSRAEELAQLESIAYSAWMTIDPDAAMTEIQRLPDSSEKDFLRAQYAGALAGKDPAKAFQLAVDAAQGDLQSLQASLNEVVWQWAESDLAGLQQRIEGESDPTLHALFLDIAGPTIASSIAYEDPVAAMSWIETLPANQQSYIKPQIFQDWVSMDIDAAIGWLQQQPMPANAQLGAAAIWQLPETHLELALSLFPTLETSAQSGVVNHLVYQIHSQQPHMLDSWIANILNPQVKQIAVSANDGLSILDNADERIAELQYLEGEEKIDRMYELFQALSVATPERIDQWMQDNPLTLTEQRLLEQRAMEQSNNGMEGCLPPYSPGMYGAGGDFRY